jgi:hypothetical protein
MTPGEIADLLETSGRSLANLLAALPPAAASWHPAAGEWCVKECVGHVIEAEKLGFAGRIRDMLAEAEPKLKGWDQAEVARARRDCDRDPGQLVNELEATRRDSLALVRSLKTDDLDRGGLHPKVARLTVNDLLHEWVHHDDNHLRQALANVQAYVWPQMGNAQRFSSG